ncbi:hypothetical protein EYV94_01280 [Puteibacter caeruleilacunae]|nr:hypothetical protein EYV94_01280 [Puteibacter caeruleilacunae]
MVLLLPLSCYIVFQTKAVQTFVCQRIANNIAEDLNTKISIGGVNIGFWNKLILEDFYIEDQEGDTLCSINQLDFYVKKLEWKKKCIHFSSAILKHPVVNLKKNRDGIMNTDFLKGLVSNEKDTVQGKWVVDGNVFGFSDANFTYRQITASESNEIKYSLDNVNFGVSNLHFDEKLFMFSLDSLSLVQRDGCAVQHISANCVVSGDTILLSKATLRTLDSHINIPVLNLDLHRYRKSGEVGDIRLKGELNSSVINFSEVALFVPQLKGMDSDVEIAGLFSGKLDDLKGKKVTISFGQASSLEGEFYMNGAMEDGEPYIYLDLKKSAVMMEDISAITFPESSKIERLVFPRSLYDAGVIHYRGNFTGFPSDFVAFGTVSSDLGRINSDLSFKPDEKGNVKFGGHLRTVNFALGKLIANSFLGSLTLNSEINGSVSANKKVSAIMNGVIDSLDINNYMLRNINLDGLLSEQLFDGTLAVNDPALALDFNGKVDFRSSIPRFDFTSDVEFVDLKALNFKIKNKVAQFGCQVSANFVGNNIDNAQGTIELSNGRYENENGEVRLNDFILDTKLKGDSSHVFIQSDHLTGKVQGKYRFSQLLGSLKHIGDKFVPSLGWGDDAKKGANNNFNFELTIREPLPVTKILMPSLIAEGVIHLEGALNESNRELEFNLDIPKVHYNKIDIKHFAVNGQTLDGQFKLKTRTDELVLGDAFSVHNLSFWANAQNDTLSTNLFWNNLDEVSYSGSLYGRTVISDSLDLAKAELSILPGKIYVADSLWNVLPAKVAIDSTAIHVDSIRIVGHNQEILLDGDISEQKDKSLNFGFKNLDLKNLDLVLDKEVGLGGRLNGKAGVFDFYDRRIFYSDLSIDSVDYQEQLLGDLTLLNRWDNQVQKIESKVSLIKDKKDVLTAFGDFDPALGALNYDCKINSLPLEVLYPVLKKSFSDIQGEASGKIHLGGTLDKISMNGRVLGKDAGLKISYMNTAYHFTDSVLFDDDKIVFEDAHVIDKDGNEGIFAGSLRHTNFSQMDYNLTITSPRILLLDTSPKENERFYGKAYASIVGRITGHAEYVKIEGVSTTKKGTSIFVPMDFNEDITESSFLKFINGHKRTPLEQIIEPSGVKGVDINFDVNATEDAKFQIIMDSRMGDVIDGEGSGNLKLILDREGNFEMFGDYQINNGSYIFTLQNVINKKFRIEQGSTIKWKGDPYNATIDVNAIYRLKASLYDLFAGVYDEEAYRSRIPVDCRILITEQLQNPNINFEIDFPTAESRIKDEFQQFVGTEEDLNKQILSLLVLNRFYTPEYQQGNKDATSSGNDVVGNTASELFSNQLSSWMSKISNEWDVGINYRPGSQTTNEEIELALSTQIFNDRVTLNGNIGNSTNSASHQSDIVGDFDLLVRLTKKLQLKAFSRTNDNLLYETSPTTQGVGIAYREEFDSIDELIAKYARILRKKKTKNTK